MKSMTVLEVNTALPHAVRPGDGEDDPLDSSEGRLGPREHIRSAANAAPRRGLRLAWNALVFGLLAAVACAPNTPPGSEVSSIQRYMVRGQVEQIDERGRLKIRHEAIEDFRAADGTPAPMEPMAMWFGFVGEKADRPEVGQRLTFEFLVDWQAEEAAQRARVGSWTVLPDGTVLALTRAPARGESKP